MRGMSRWGEEEYPEIVRLVSAAREVDGLEIIHTAGYIPVIDAETDAIQYCPVMESGVADTAHNNSVTCSPTLNAALVGFNTPFEASTMALMMLRTILNDADNDNDGAGGVRVPVYRN